MIRVRFHLTYLALLGCLWLLPYHRVVADGPLAIGIPRSEFGSSLLDQRSLLGRIASPLLTRALFSESSVSQLQFDLATGYSLSADYREAAVTARTTAQFASGKSITGYDYRRSLLGCIQRGVLPRGTSVDLLSPGDPAVGSPARFTVVTAEPQPELRLILARCPILESESLKLAGAELGSFGILIGSGRYEVTQFLPGKHLMLTILPGESRHAGGGGSRPPSTVSLRGYEDGVMALSALRAGDIDGFFIPPSQAARPAASDETVVESNCGEFLSFSRRGRSFPCFGRLPDL